MQFSFFMRCKQLEHGIQQLYEFYSCINMLVTESNCEFMFYHQIKLLNYRMESEQGCQHRSFEMN